MPRASQRVYGETSRRSPSTPSRPSRSSRPSMWLGENSEEVQEVRVTAAGRRAAEDFVDLDVYLRRSHPSQRSRPLEGHRTEKQRVYGIAASPARGCSVLGWRICGGPTSKMACGFAENDFTVETPREVLDGIRGRDPRHGSVSLRPRLLLPPGLRALRYRSLPMDYEAWFLKEALEELVPFRDGVGVVEDGVDWLITYPYTAGDVPAP